MQNASEKYNAYKQVIFNKFFLKKLYDYDILSPIILDV